MTPCGNCYSKGEEPKVNLTPEGDLLTQNVIRDSWHSLRSSVGLTGVIQGSNRLDSNL